MQRQESRSIQPCLLVQSPRQVWDVLVLKQKPYSMALNEEEYDTICIIEILYT